MTTTTYDERRAYYAATNAAERAERSAAQAAVSQARQALQALRLAEARLDRADRLNTYALQQTVAQGTASPGAIGEARALLAHPALDTIARRERALSIAWTGQNLGIYGRWSAAVHAAAADLTRMIEQGREGEQHYTERTAEEARATDKEYRDSRHATAAAAYRNAKAKATASD